MSMKLGASLAAAFALAAAGSLVGAAAPAEAHYKRATNYFHFPAKAPRLEVTLTGTVRLQPGYWQHGAYFAHTLHRTDPDLGSRRIGVLTPGRYGWRVVRWWSINRRQYMVESTLRRGSWSHRVREGLPRHGAHSYGDGWYEWGGRLAFDGPIGVTVPSRNR